MKLDLKKYLNPAPEIGGLEISDLVLRFAMRESGGRLLEASVQIPPGIVSGGKIIDRPKMLAALKGLHQHVAPLKKVLHAVVLIPTNNVYAQAFVMPLVPQKDVDQTARLNLQTISPIDIDSAYYGYQLIGENKKGQIEALGAFVAKQEVDDLTAVLKEANFNIIAIEFPALAMARLVNNYATGLKQNAPHLVVYLGSDGPDIMVMKNGHLYFNYFTSWATLQEEIGGRKVSPQDVQDFMMRNVKQVMNFYTSRWGEPIQDTLIVDSPIAKEINQTVQANFNLNTQPFHITKYGNLSPLWYPVVGAMERGLIPRAKDTYISLTAVGVEQEYYHELTLGFIKAWRNIIVGVLGFMLVALLVGDSLLARAVAEGQNDLTGRGLVPLEEIQRLQADVRKFNQAVDFALAAQNVTPAWSGFYSKMKTLTGTQVTLQRLFIDPNLSGLMLGRAVSDSAVIAFKNTLSRDPAFKDVSLPLSNIKVNEDGSVSFSLNFKLTSLKF